MAIGMGCQGVDGRFPSTFLDKYGSFRIFEEIIPVSGIKELRQR